MSEQTVLEFGDTVLADPDLRAKCQGAPDLASLVAIAADAGFRFTEEDVLSYATRLQQAEELGEGELEAAAGGSIFNNNADPGKVTITNNHIPNPLGVTVNNSHRGLFGLFGLL